MSEYLISDIACNRGAVEAGVSKNGTDDPVTRVQVGLLALHFCEVRDVGELVLVCPEGRVDGSFVIRIDGARRNIPQETGDGNG